VKDQVILAVQLSLGQLKPIHEQHWESYHNLKGSGALGYSGESCVEDGLR